MTEAESGPVPANVTQEQINELRGDLWLPLVMLVPMFAFAVFSANLPAAVFLGAAIAASVGLAIHRSRNPTEHLGRYTDPISRSVLRANGLEPREGEDSLALQIRVIDTIDTLASRPLTLAGAGRRIALGVAFVLALTGVGLLTPLPGDKSLFFALFGAAYGLVTSELPKRRRVAKATEVLEQQLHHLGSLEANSLEELPGHQEDAAV